jgi:hypothetical protein
VKVADLEGAGGVTVTCKPANPISAALRGLIAISPSLGHRHEQLGVYHTSRG